MNEIFIDFLVKELIEKKDCILLKDENGSIPEYHGSRILERQTYGSSMLLEILDGDRFSSQEIKERLDRNIDALLNIDRQSLFFFEIVVFRAAPDMEKLEAIKNGQYQKYPGKKFLGCITVELTAKKVDKHYKLPLSSGGLEKHIQKTVSENWQHSSESINLMEVLEKKEKEATLTFAARKPYLSYALIGINIIVMLAIYLYGIKTNTDFNTLLNRFGAKSNIGIMAGEYWRFITPIFLHADPMHLLVNCYSIYAVGLFVEKLFGHTKFAFIYLFAGIVGNIASFIFSINLGVGASGAIFGLLGALLYYGLENPTQFRRYFGHNVILTIVMNIGYGFSRTGIDNFAHIGGLIGGFIASGAIRSKKLQVKYLNRAVFITLAIAVTVGGLYYGFNNKQNVVLKKVSILEKQGADSKWAEVEKTAEEILGSGVRNESIKLEAFIYVAQAETELGKYEEAIGHGKEMLNVDSAWGHYVLGISYYNTKQYDKAKEELLEAKRLKADFNDIDDLLKKIEESSK